MLRKIRITLATVVFTLITLLFLDFTGTMTWAGILAKLQFLPALLAGNLIIVILLVVLTLVFGRIYCSVICPMGILQDILAKLNWKKNRFTYSPALNWLRYIMLAVLAVSMVLGISSVTALLAPYSSFGRIAQNLMQPIYIYCNNLLASVAESMNSYAFYTTDLWVRSMPTLIIAAVTFVLILVLAVIGGRTYCNTICPVGTILGFLSRFSLLKVVIDTDKCKNCRKCERNCKASCIDIKNHTIDYSRCVTCGNCLGNCNFGAMKYSVTFGKSGETGKTGNSAPSSDRRAFIVGTGLAIAGTALAQEKKKVDGGLAIIEAKVAPVRNTSLTPPGSLSAKNMQSKCTACQLCVSNCPNGVLRPSTDLQTLMQPTMSYERGYCRPECNECSNVCPTGAIKPITLAEKTSTQIGHAVWVKKNCIPVTEGVSCGNCERHCPAGAITMIHLDDNEEGPMVPAVNESRCIGCGACENLCPARPFSAIYVEGHEVHKEI